jgi:DNA-damage-inducible protein D
MINTFKEAIRQVDDYKLSRYACYLIAQNGNSQKQAIALAQTYFATQTRKQELFETLTDDEKRLLTRGEVTDHNKKLFQTAKDSGVKNFGKFNDAGYLGLYGLTNQQIVEKKKLGDDKLLDRAGATELAANLFRITQTDEQLKTKLDEGRIIGEHQASRTHFVVGGKVRKAIKDIGGAMPEDLPPQEHIEKVKKRLEIKGSSRKDLSVSDGTKRLPETSDNT